MESNSKNPNTEPLSQNMLTHKGVPNYLHILKAKPVNDKVGQTFITSTKKQKKNQTNS